MTELPTRNMLFLEPTNDHECVNAWQALRSVYERVSASLADALARECGITLNDYQVLVHVASVEPKQPRLGDLHAAVTLSQPALSRLVMRLEQQGLLSRIDADDDRRTVLVALTDAGRALLEKAAPIHADCVRILLNDNLSEREQESLVSTFARIEGNQP